MVCGEFLGFWFITISPYDEQRICFVRHEWAHNYADVFGFVHFKVSTAVLSTQGKGRPSCRSLCRINAAGTPLSLWATCRADQPICWVVFAAEKICSSCCQWLFDHHCPPLQISALFIPGKKWFDVFFHSVTERCCSVKHFVRTVESIMEKVCSCNLTYNI